MEKITYTVKSNRVTVMALNTVNAEIVHAVFTIKGNPADTDALLKKARKANENHALVLAKVESVTPALEKRVCTVDDFMKYARPLDEIKGEKVTRTIKSNRVTVMALNTATVSIEHLVYTINGNAGDPDTLLKKVIKMNTDKALTLAAVENVETVEMKCGMSIDRFLNISEVVSE